MTPKPPEMSSIIPRTASRTALVEHANTSYEHAVMRVWIDQDLCTGDGICEDLCPEVFVILEDGIAYVREGDLVMNDPGQHTGLARVAPEHEGAVVAAASYCPGECIFIEPLTS